MKMRWTKHNIVIAPLVVLCLPITLLLFLLCWLMPLLSSGIEYLYLKMPRFEL